MPSLTRASGVDIHWEEQGEGPLVLFVHHFSAYPDVHRDLLDDLARDHRVVTYDPRGSGRSSRQGPYDLETDMGDLAALARELGGGAAAVGLGDGRDRATRIAAAEPALIRAVVGCGASPVGRSMGAIEGPGASRPVLDAIVDLLNTNFRTALREMLQLTNPGMTEDALRERLDATVAYSSPEAITVRSRWFLRDDTVSAATRASPFSSGPARCGASDRLPDHVRRQPGLRDRPLADGADVRLGQQLPYPHGLIARSPGALPVGDPQAVTDRPRRGHRVVPQEPPGAHRDRRR